MAGTAPKDDIKFCFININSDDNESSRLRLSQTAFSTAKAHAMGIVRRCALEEQSSGESQKASNVQHAWRVHLRERKASHLVQSRSRQVGPAKSRDGEGDKFHPLVNPNAERLKVRQKQQSPRHQYLPMRFISRRQEHHTTTVFSDKVWFRCRTI